ncbi:MAG: hypothetical protein ABI728_15355 [Betaproteobacteria bacterium]
MAKINLRNAYYRGWFAARARRPTPEPDIVEEHFFINMGFTQGKLSNGAPLRQWSKSIEPGMPANLDIEVTPDNARFSTRPRQEPAMTGRNDHRPAQKDREEEDLSQAQSPAGAFPSADTEEDTGTLEAQQKKHNPRLPEKKPQTKLPGKSAYSSGKRRPARFAR